MTIDKAVLTEMTDRLVEAVSAVGLLNGHVASIAKFYACQQAIMSSGKAPPGC